jgi:hypothetical protein
LVDHTSRYETKVDSLFYGHVTGEICVSGAELKVERASI